MSTKHPSITLALALAVVLALPSGALALNYTGSQKNQPTFETLEEARESGPKAVATIEGNAGRTFKSHPALDSIPKGTVFVYRSGNLYGGRAAARLNTDVLIFSDKHFATKEEAQQYIGNTGLMKFVDQVKGSIILVTPANGTAFGPADQKNYYGLQTAIFSQKVSEALAGGGGAPGGRGGRGAPGAGPGGPGGPVGPGGPGAGPAGFGGAPGAGGPGATPGGPVASGPGGPAAGGPAGGGRGAPGAGGLGRGAPGGFGGFGGGGAVYADGEYFGGFGYTYVIGIDGGATFLNDYVVGTVDYVSRIAGMLLINGKMDQVRPVAGLVPVYLVNAPDAVVEKYKKANNTNAYAATGDMTKDTSALAPVSNLEIFFDQSLPLKRVIVAKDPNPSIDRYITDAWFNLFLKAMRVPVTKTGMYSAGTPYQGYSMDQAPLSLCERNPVLNDNTPDGIRVIAHTEDTLSDLKAQNGEYLQQWWDYFPEEVVNKTAPAGTVPLILACHGGGDDPRQFVEEIGILPLAGKERFAIVAPDHTSVANLLSDALPRLVKLTLKNNPALDPSRVYVTGYSMGGAATLRGINGDPSVFAAAVPMAAAPYTGTAEQVKQFEKAHLPVMFTTSSYDLGGAFDSNAGHIAAGYQTQLNLFLGYNGMKPLTFDFNTYPVNGFKADSMIRVNLNGEYDCYRWFLNDAAGTPMVALAYTMNLQHALYPEYGKIAWDFFKRYSRDQKTGIIKYNPYAR
jgi:pimeloyl-ACP methyl ester carboxylesterase